MPNNWIKETDDDTTKLYKYIKCQDPSVVPRISHSVIVKRDGTWSAHVGTKCIDSALNHFPAMLDFNTILHLITEIDAYNICVGNTDDKFVEAKNHCKNHQIMNRSGSSVAASIDEKGVIDQGGIYHHVTVHTSSCSIVVKGKDTCFNCAQYRNNLRSIYSRYRNKL